MITTMTNEQAIAQYKDTVNNITEQIETSKGAYAAFKVNNYHWEEQAAKRLQNLKEAGLNTEELEEVFNSIKQSARHIEEACSNSLSTMEQAVNKLNSIAL